ncbi:TetR/AcrR family transcriptional regulator [Sulfurovum sp. zt1-1]|uniref:TetR/AcrR family transcriptional regulator n=1 Tax=Sulfurovum zhangzhouensis TaxID=3019067 RepID=A0ABT7QY83_9BACT|nr:TetR/AcrR family transcriptional regulator [Sulfurovum zhangzhouensis]MDM5271797.1 TetR/AcrR family transcriptional regulator [Sulfurovum zhangzhouensis]
MNKEQPTREKILDVVFELVYMHGYNGTSMSMILKACGIPKGSLYHFFKSKKEMVLTVIKERLGPKMDIFFTFELIAGKDGIDSIIDAVLTIANNPMLIKYGCPLNRLNQEMSPLDEDFDREITLLYDHIKAKIIVLLRQSELKPDTDVDSLSDFVIETVWGALSLSPTQSSTGRYLHSVKHLNSYLGSLRK